MTDATPLLLILPVYLTVLFLLMERAHTILFCSTGNPMPVSSFDVLYKAIRLDNSYLLRIGTGTVMETNGDNHRGSHKLRCQQSRDVIPARMRKQMFS